MSTEFTESELRDWLNEHIETLLSSIENLDSITESLKARIDAFHARRYTSDAELIEQSLQAVLAQRFLDSLLAFQSCGSIASLGTERPLIDSDLPGRDPSADILAVAEEAGAFIVVEVKIAVGPARQSITEMSAYSNGLASRFWGLSAFDSIWVLVSTVYRPTVAAAVVYQQALAGRCVVPLLATPTVTNGQIASVRLEIEDLSRYAAIPVGIADALFSSAVYELHAAHFSRRVPDAALHFLSTEYMSRGAIGFCFRRTPSAADLIGIPYPHGLASALLNPFKLHRKVRQLAIVAEHPSTPRGSAAYMAYIGQDCFDEHDVDLTSWDDHWKKLDRGESDETKSPADEAEAELSPTHSLFELSIREMASEMRAFGAVMEYLRDQGLNAAGAWSEVGGVDFGGSFFPCMGAAHHRPSNTSTIRYFGVLHDILAHISKNVVHNDPEFAQQTVLEAYESPRLLFRLLRSMNPKLGG